VGSKYSGLGDVSLSDALHNMPSGDGEGQGGHDVDSVGSQLDSSFSVNKEGLICQHCTKTFKTSQGLAGHRRRSLLCTSQEKQVSLSDALHNKPSGDGEGQGGHDADSVGSQLDSPFSVNKEASGEVPLIFHNVPPEVLGGLQKLVTRISVNSHLYCQWRCRVIPRLPITFASLRHKMDVVLDSC